MSYLISTHSGLWRADESGRCRLISQGYYYGIAAYEGGFIAARRLYARTKDSPTIVESYDSDGRRKAWPEIDGHPITDVHQIDHDDDGVLWLCDGQEKRLWRWSEADGLNYLQFAGGELLNSVHPTDDDLLWLVFHNRGRQRSVAFRIDPSQEEHFQPVDLAYDGVHNILPRGQMLYFNASDDGAVCRRKPDGLVEPLSLGSEWHPKGMAEENGYLYVGVSEREVSLEERFTSQSHIAVINLDEWKLEHELHFDRTLGNINEIRRLP